MDDETAKELGFKDADEFYEMMCAVDTSTEEKIDNYLMWQIFDGTKEGILKLEFCAEFCARSI